MIKSITVTNHVGDSIKLDLARPELSGFAVTSIQGIGAGTATINTSEVATNDGSRFTSARLPQRNIVIDVKFLWKPTIEAVRQQSYKYFPLKKKITLLFETDNRLAEITGYVESNDPTIFSKDEGTSISILCPDPYFYAVGPNGTVTTLFSGIEPRFEFAFHNDSLTKSLLVMSSIENKTENVIVYDGDADIGVTVTIHAVGEASNISIYNTRTREFMRIDTNKLRDKIGSEITYGDDIVICTVKNRKSVTFMRNGISYNILNCLDRNSDWFTLTKGDNIFAYTAESGAINLQFKVEHQIVYEGV